MKREEIQSRLERIYQEVFHDDTIALTDEMTAEDIEEWDSLTHLQLIMQIERSFAIRFTTLQLKNMSNVGMVIDRISEALSKPS